MSDALGHWEENVRATAADSLAEIGLPAAATAIPKLRQALNDPFEEVRDSAAGALAKLDQIGQTHDR